MTEPDPVAVEAALTPALAEAAAEVHAWTRAMAERAVNGWDFVSIGPGPELPRLRLRSLRVLAEHAQKTARAVNDVRSVADMTGASIVAPDPLKLPAYAWGESVTWNQGRILVPLNRDNETVADLVLDEDDAGTLAAMLDDAAGHKPPDCPRCFDRGYVPDWSRGLSAEHGEPGKKPCPDCQGTQENQA